MPKTQAANAGGNLPDPELARRIAAGDHAALETLMRRYNQKLYRTARSILKDDAEAEDAVQDAYLLAIRAIARFRGDAGLSTWLVRIVVNEALGRLRKRSRRAEIIELSGDADMTQITDESEAGRGAPESPDGAALRKELRSLIEAKIDQLPDAFRTVFVLRTLEEMPVEEVAACLDIPEATVRTRYFRAKGLLRESLARDIDVGIGDSFSFAGARCDRIVTGVFARLEFDQPNHDQGDIA